MGTTIPTSPQPLLPSIDAALPHDPSVHTGLAGTTAEPLVPVPGTEPPPAAIPEAPNKSGSGEGSPSGSGEATTMTAAEYQAMMDAIRAAGDTKAGSETENADPFAKDSSAKKSYEDEMANIRRELDMSFDPKTGDGPDTKALEQQFVQNPVDLANQKMEEMREKARERENRGEKKQAYNEYFNEVDSRTRSLDYRARLLAEKAGATKNPTLKAQLLKMADGLKADALHFRNQAEGRQQQMQGSNSRDKAQQYLALFQSGSKMTSKQKANLQELLAKQGYKVLDGRLVALKTKPTPAKNTGQARTAGGASKKSPARTAEKTAAPETEARESAGEKLAAGKEKPTPEKSNVAVPNEREVEVAAKSVASQVDPRKREERVKNHGERHALIAGAKTLLAVSAEDEVAALDKGDKGASNAAGRMKKSALGVYRHAYQRGWDNLLDGNQSPEEVVLTGKERNIQAAASDNGSDGAPEIFSVTPDESEKFAALRGQQRRIFGTETAFVGDFEGGYLGHFRNWRPRGERDLRAADLQRGRDFSSARA